MTPVGAHFTLTFGFVLTVWLKRKQVDKKANKNSTIFFMVAQGWEELLEEQKNRAVAA